MKKRATMLGVCCCVWAVACQKSSPSPSPASSTAPLVALGPKTPLKHVIVIALENHDAESLFGNLTDAPYFNSLVAQGSSASNFRDTLPLAIPSEPHYVWMEAGTSQFVDHTFVNDASPSERNSTASTEHLSTQLDAAGLSWIAYQEGLDETSGACPIQSSGFYQPKHNPFIFFRDVAGSPPSKTNPRCAEHHKPLTALAADLKHGLPAYSFITPDQCHDMHGQSDCPEPNTIAAGDKWLSEELPALREYAAKNAGVVFLVFDEGEQTPQLPFLALGPTIKSGYVGTALYTHSSLLKTVERIFGVPVLPSVQSANDFSDLFASAPY